MIHAQPHPLLRHHLLLLNQRLKHGPHTLRALLREPLLPTLIIDKRDPKPRLIAFSPLEVIHQTPCQITPNIDTVFRNSLTQRINISPEILDSKVVFENLLKRQIILAFERGAVFGAVDFRVVVAF